MNILITGGDKPLGKAFAKHLGNKHKIFLMNENTLDITNRVETLRTISNINPEIVIHCDEIDNIEKCEKNENLAYTVNTIGCLNVAYSCYSLDIPIIYLSTNYVYDGKKESPYYETDNCTPINVYGKTKLAGEKLIQTLYNKFFIIRCGWLFGEENNFIQKILNNRDVPVFMCSNEIGSPTYIEDVCTAVDILLSTNYYGIYNCANPDPVNKSLWVKYILDCSNIKKEIIEIPQNYIPNCAPRPHYSAIETTLLKNCFNIKLPNWRERTKTVVANINKKPPTK
ncbi:SDR family oxidoreductase [Clostridium ganghwense]|uniref:dTDP-4-dehydrorhamnose reductase n=1 Tax=Clostridium ganghwense TaxID=312089 RepID=A0ABT4CQW2_9CLOT|nr:NAD(P)-dependent oxidoreductase [Clostridium ganghwense]MCY6370828.1 NAD(P)-dependent oxidoreductase [Clostridium ganghwense]